MPALVRVRKKLEKRTCFNNGKRFLQRFSFRSRFSCFSWLWSLIGHGRSCPYLEVKLPPVYRRGISQPISCYRKKEEESNDFPNSVRKKNQFVRAGAEKQSTEWVPVVHKWRHWTDQDLVNSLSFLIQIRKNFFRYWSHAWAVSLLASPFCVRNCPKRFDWIPCFHGPYLCPGTGRHVGLFRAFLGAHLHLLKVGVVAIDRLGHS